MTSSTTVGSGLFANRYELKKSLGQGSAGKVYLAYDTVLQEHVALKTLNEALTLDEVQVKRFMREVSVTRKVTHPNVIRTYDVGWVDSTLFFTMEHVPGRTLKERLAGEPLSVEQGLSVLYEICKGLHAIHESDIVHRDLKLTNIIVGDDGFIKIGDFGIARPGVSDLTANDDLIGTATHMAPEVWRSGVITKRTDLYAIGVIMYEIFAGVLPFSGNSPMELMYHHLNSNPPSICEINPSVPRWIDTLALQLLSKDSDERPSSVEEIIYQIENGGLGNENKTSSSEIRKSASQSLEFTLGPAVLNDSINSTLKPSVEFPKKASVTKKKHYTKGITVSTWTLIAVLPLCFSPAIFNYLYSHLVKPETSGKAFLHFLTFNIATFSFLCSWPLMVLATKRENLKVGLITFFSIFTLTLVGAFTSYFHQIWHLFSVVPFGDLFGFDTEYVKPCIAAFEISKNTLIRIVYFSFSTQIEVLIGSTALIAAISLIVARPPKLFRALIATTLLFGLLLLFRSGEIHGLSTELEGSSHGLLLPIAHAARLFLVWGSSFLILSYHWNRDAKESRENRRRKSSRSI